ncbi:MAG: AAA family ATPase [Armatimonadetes bacterium]|nr:AAA family ATPase [Armatimonadota bacterium]
MMNVYVGATRQNDGKTITCLGLIAALKKRLANVGYIKPVGQRYVEMAGRKVDEDAFLIKEVYKLRGDLSDMSPIAVPRYFTENYIDQPNREALVETVKDAYKHISFRKDIVVVEGTGHAGVGSVFDMSNGDVAALLGCKAVIVSSGGIGRPIDEIMLNKAMFDSTGVEIVGAIVNKVDENKYDKVKSYVTRGLERKGVEVLGVMPYKPMLSSPTVEQLLEDIDGKVIGGEANLGRVVEKTVIGAMPPHQALEYLTNDTLLITPGTREDMILAAMSSCLLGGPAHSCVPGMILTGGTAPQPSIMDLITKIDMPVILVNEDTYTVASKIAKLIVKIRPGDTEKIRAAEEMVDQFVNVDRLLEKLQARK